MTSHISLLLVPVTVLSDQVRHFLLCNSKQAAQL